MRVLTAILALAAFVLPPAHRARWREEAAALLIEVRGPRRWWFALDIVLKAPMLAWCHRGAEPPPAVPGRAVAALTGAGLLAMPVVAAAAILLAPVIGEDTAEFLFLVSPCGLFGFVAVRSFRRARQRGGGPARLTGAALLSIFAGTGPVAAGALSVAVDVPMIAVAGALPPGLWLAAVSARSGGPALLRAFGVVAGASLTGFLLGVQLLPDVPALAGVSFLLLVPTYLVWSTWTGVRLLRGRARQLA